MYEEVIKHYPDFPKEGIDFIDVLPFLQRQDAFRGVVEAIDRLGTAPNMTAVEARGFLFSSPLLVASSRVRALLPVRKKGKIPYREGDLRRVAVEKEYGADELYYRVSDLHALVPTAGKAVEITLFDDFLATGGTALELARALEREVVDGLPVRITEFIFLAELPLLGGRRALEPIAPVHALMSLDGVE